MALTDDDIEALIRLYDQESSRRSNWLSVWAQVADYVLPSKSSPFRHTSGHSNPRNELYDSTAEQSNEVLASSLSGMITPSSQPWFMATTDEVDTHDEQVWLEECSSLIGRYLSQSNFYSSIDEYYLDCGAFGTSVMLIEEDDDTLFRFSARHINECVLVENHSGRVDTLIRSPDMTSRQLQQKFPDLPQKLKEDCQKNPDRTHKVIHVIKPREQFDVTKRAKTSKPIASIWIHRDSKELLLESGFDELPFCAQRWRKRTGEPYGTGPGIISLPDVRLLQSMEAVDIKTRQLAMAPPMAIQGDQMQGNLQIKPFGVTPIRDINRRPQPLLGGIDPRMNNSQLELKRKQIQTIFFNDILLTSDGPERTATEILQRTDERAKVMTALLGRFSNETLTPLIERVFAICLRKRVFPEPPASLHGKRLVFRFLSPLFRLSNLSQVEGIQRTVQALMPLAQVDPSVLQMIDMDAVVRETAKIYGAPAKILKSPERLAEEREASQQASSAQQLLGAADPASKGIERLAKAESIAPPDGAVAGLLADMRGQPQAA